MQEELTEIDQEPSRALDRGPEECAFVRRPIRERALDVLGNVRGRLRPIVWFALAFELVRWVVLAPLGTAALRLLLDRWGRASVGNFEVLTFLLSPPGWVALIVAGTLAVATFYLELGGLMLLLADRRATAASIVAELGGRFFRLLGLGLRQFVILLALAAPFLGTILGTLSLLWAGRDLNGLIVLKPPVFWLGVVLSASLGTGYAVAGGLLVLRWLLAVPAVLVEPDTGAREAMRRSTQQTRGRLIPMLRLVLVWLVAVVLLSVTLMGALRFGSGWVLDRLGLALPVLLPATAVVLILHALVAAFLSVVNAASFASLVLVLYREICGVALPPPESLPRPPGMLARVPARWLNAGCTLALVGTVGLICYGLLAGVRLQERLEITAHRGGAAVAPENTVAAIHQAIKAQADWAEIDVQRTADGAIVVLHDNDLARVGGLHQRVAESTLSQIKSVDVGSRFGADFRGERVPTLDQLLAAADRRIRLNIELKPNGPDDVAPLVKAVLDSVKRAGIADRCRLCSQSYDSLLLVRQLEPGLPVGFIAGARLGDLSQLDVNFLMVAQRLATRKLVDAARVRGITVQAWTINDPDALVSLLDQGVDNIITDDPKAMRCRLEEIQEVSPAARLLLRARNLLAQ